MKAIHYEKYSNLNIVLTAELAEGDMVTDLALRLMYEMLRDYNRMPDLFEMSAQEQTELQSEIDVLCKTTILGECPRPARRLSEGEFMGYLHGIPMYVV